MLYRVTHAELMFAVHGARTSEEVQTDVSCVSRPFSGCPQRTAAKRAVRAFLAGFILGKRIPRIEFQPNLAISDGANASRSPK